ncbi:MAG: LptF/LptG family permease [Phycisphaerales bacterium]|nr:LptF/LptG family permease [Phycisphaerales bacterium]
MIKTFDRYILRAFFTNYMIALGVLIGLYVILDLFVNLDEFTNIQAASTLQTVFMITDFYGHNMFLYFAQLAGVITLVAGCFTLGRLHRTNELTAILATGTSLYRVAAPVLLAGLAMNTLWLIDQELVIPNIAGKLARKHGDIEGRQTFAIWFLPDPKQNNALVSATMFNPGAEEMRGVIIIQRDENDQMTGMIQADQAKWDEERGHWHLKNGYRRQLEATTAETGADDLESVAVYASSLTPKQLALQQSAQWTMFLSLPEINELLAYFKDRGTGEFIKVKHTRITTVIMNMALLCIGIPFFLNRERPSVVIQGGKCLLACGICYVTTFFCNTVDLSVLGLSPALPPWLPILIFTPFAVLLLDGIKT